MGSDFYIAYVAPSIKCGAVKPFQSVYVVVSTAYDCNVTLSYFDATQGGQEVTGTTTRIFAKHSANIQLDLNYMDPKDANGNRINTDGEVPMYNACRIHGDRPISVSYYSTGPNAGASYLALPTPVLGKDYVVASFPANPALGAANSHHFTCTVDSGSSEFAVIAIKDNTNVTIAPNGLTRQGQNGHTHPFDAKLMRGQVYWVKSTLDNSANDMSGSLVHADQPVAVLSANEDAFNGQSQYVSSGGDQRNMMLQQMVPTQYLRSSGYLTMPLMDSPGLPPGDPSEGDALRLLAPSGTGGTADIALYNMGSQTRQVSAFPSTTQGVENVIVGANVSERFGQKIMVEQYDYKAMSQEPYTAPTMMNIVPIASYATSFAFGVPDDRNQVHKRRFINVIARQDQFSSIKVQLNGSAPTPLTSLPSAGSTASIPGHAELNGRRYEIQPGGYFIHGDSAFIVYQYGMLGIDPDFDLGDNDDDDYYFEYASPTGETFGIEGVTAAARFTIDTICNGWRLHVRDTTAIDGGIAQIELLRDALGVEARRSNADSGYVSVNCSTVPTNFTVVPGATDTIADILVNDPLKSADAWVRIVNVGGKDTVIHLHYTPPALSMKPDSADFINASIGVDTCTHFTFKNLGKPGDVSFNVFSYKWLQGGQSVRLTSTNPPLPFKLGPGDSILLNVCFNATQPAHVYYDTLILQTDCPTPMVSIIGTTTVPKINTEDYDFGTVVVGKKKCHAIRVWNPGAAPFMLTKQWVLDNFIDFEFSDTAMLPLAIKQGEGVYLNFCFTPTVEGWDTTYMRWTSDIPEPFTHVIKDVSRLSGRGIRPKLKWSTDHLNFGSVFPKTLSITLFDSGTAGVHVDSVRIVGTDTGEFQITANATGHLPMDNFDLLPESGDSVEISFIADPLKHGDRRDTLWAFDREAIFPVAFLFGSDGVSGVSEPVGIAGSELRISSTTHPGYLTVYPPQSMRPGYRLRMFDAVGRVVSDLRGKGERLEIEENWLPIGLYFIEVTGESGPNGAILRTTAKILH